MIITNDQKLSHKCYSGLDPESKASERDAEMNLLAECSAGKFRMTYSSF
jgi:hypothetical protein